MVSGGGGGGGGAAPSGGPPAPPSRKRAGFSSPHAAHRTVSISRVYGPPSAVLVPLGLHRLAGRCLDARVPRPQLAQRALVARREARQVGGSGPDQPLSKRGQHE